MKFHSIQKLRGEITVPGDKSISHRAVMFGALAKGKTEITGFLRGADCLSTISCFRQMGISIEETADKIVVCGEGLHGLRAPSETLDTGNSGTTTRLLAGILAGQNFTCVLNGDASIQKRPMKRVIDPLSQMGADIRSIHENGCAPLRVTGSPLHGISYHSPVASAQVKSAVLLAGLYAEGATSVTEPAVSRNHTELMLRSFGADVHTVGLTATVNPAPNLRGMEILVPGDISSAAYFIAAGCLVPDAEILIRNVGINPTRDGILRVAKEMGADISLLNRKETGEPTADLLVKSSSLHGITIGGDIIPTLIDELPVIAVMAAAAGGTTIIKDAAELKVKESDRITVMTENLAAMGCNVTATPDGMVINGGSPLHGAVIDPHLDHRIAMSFAIAAMIADGETEIKNAGCVEISYPAFYEDLRKITYPASPARYSPCHKC